MFDIGFPELLIVAIVALLVLGPERLPETLRTVGLWIGRFRRMFSDVKADIEREIGADEIRQQIHNESVMKDLKQTENSIRQVTQQPLSDLASSGLETLTGQSDSQKSDTATPETIDAVPTPTLGQNQVPASSQKKPDQKDEPLAVQSVAALQNNPSADTSQENESVKSN